MSNDQPNPAATAQPQPRANNSTPIVDLVLADIAARAELGLQRYGTKLQAHNGRDPLVDAYEESIDQTMYLRQEIAERDAARRLLGSKPRVLLDVDGVLADFIGGFLALINAAQGTAIAPEHITSFDISASLGWDGPGTTAAYQLITDREGFAADLAVLPGAVDGVHRLNSLAEVYIVTSPWWSHPTWLRDRTDWLYRHFGIFASRTVHTSAKHLVVGDVLVDDKTETCRIWQEAHPRGVAVQWRTLHNRRDAWTGPSTSSWDELLEIVERKATEHARHEVARDEIVPRPSTPAGDAAEYPNDEAVTLGGEAGDGS